MIELLFLITSIKDDKKLRPFFNKYKLPFNLVNYASGTASHSMLVYFGLEEIRNYIYFTLIDHNNRNVILTDLNKTLKLTNPGNGIAFTIPLSSSTKHIKDKIKNNNQKEVPMEKEIKNNNSKEYHLIVTVITEGYSDNVMTAAKKAGAPGGTLIKGRSLVDNDKRKQFLGFSIEPEKDVVLIATNSTIKNQIMEAITKETGLKTKGGGIVFSLPISEAIGLYE